MAYDALGRCVKRTLSGGPTTYYVYDGDKPIVEYDSSGASAGVNVYGKGVDEPSEWRHREMDGQAREGNGRAERERRSQYEATYRSTYTTAAFNFYEYRARAYNAKLGRFMSEDPKLFDAGDYNLFRYCHNDPMDNVDPMGLADERREPWYNHEEQAKQLAKLQTLLNQKLLLGYGAISLGGLQYAIQIQTQLLKDYTTARQAFAGQKEVSALFARTDDSRVTLQRSNSFLNSREDVYGVQEGSKLTITASWNPRAAIKTTDGRAQSPATALVHILDHVDRILRFGARAYNADHFYPDSRFGNREDRRVITGLERAAAEYLHEGVRSDGGGRYFPVQSVLDNGE
jgi:RHS repeat-associated protein